MLIGLYKCVFVYLWRPEKDVWFLALEVLVFESCLVWMLRAELWCSAKTARVRNYGAMAQVP